MGDLGAGRVSMRREVPYVLSRRGAGVASQRRQQTANIGSSISAVNVRCGGTDHGTGCSRRRRGTAAIAAALERMLYWALAPRRRCFMNKFV